MPTPLLQVENLSKFFVKDQPVLKSISFNLNKGSWTILAGHNGSGKTVLMNHLNGLESPKRGRVLFEGKDIKKMGDEIRQKVGLVFQNSDLQFVEQTVRKEIAFGPTNLRLPTHEIARRVSHVVEQLGIENLLGRRPHTLSGGEKKRVAIGGILAMNPEVLVLDEPFTGLDWKGVDQVLKTLIKLHKEGLTILLITHDLEKCVKHCDNLIVLSQGELRVEGPPHEILPLVEQWGIRRPQEITWLR